MPKRTQGRILGITPVDLTYDSIDKGQEASYIRCSTEDMEKFLGEIYGKTYNIMQGQLRNVADEARNANGITILIARYYIPVTLVKLRKEYCLQIPQIMPLCK